MTSAMRRPALLIAVLAVLGGALTACGSGPSQINSAVIIGDRVISVDEVQDRLDTALDKEPATRDIARGRRLDLVSRGIVTQLVRHELIAEAARRERLTVAEKDVAEFVAATAPSEDPVQRSVDAAFDSRELARDRLLIGRLGQSYLERLQVTIDGAAVLSPTDARTVATDLARKIAADPGRSAELIEQAASQELNPIVGQPFNPVSTYEVFLQNERQVLLTPIFGVAANTVIAFPVGAGEQAATNAWLVALVKSRTTNGSLPAEQAGAVSQVESEWFPIIGIRVLSPMVGELGVRISPRYGIWDELAVGVAPSDGEQTGLVLAAANPRP